MHQRNVLVRNLGDQAMNKDNALKKWFLDAMKIGLSSLYQDDIRAPSAWASKCSSAATTTTRRITWRARASSWSGHRLVEGEREIGGRTGGDPREERGGSRENPLSPVT
jgi:hypothetical protein